MDDLELWIKEGDKIEDILALNYILGDAILQY